MRFLFIYLGILTLLCLSVSVSLNQPRSGGVQTNQLMALRPLAVQGRYSLPSGQDLDCVFLGRKELDVISADEEKEDQVLVCDLVPLLLTRRPFSDPDQYRTSVLSPNPIVNRDAGFYDSLPFTWAASIDEGGLKRAQEAKKAVFDKCSIVKGNPGLALLKVIKEVMDAEVSGLFIEVVDEYGGGNGGVVLGAGAIVAQGEASDKYRISRKSDAAIRSVGDLRNLPMSKPWVETNQVDERIREMLAQEESEKGRTDRDDSSSMVTTVTCHLDEVVGLSRSLDMPIWVPRGLFDKVCEDVRLTKSPMLLSAPSAGKKTPSSPSSARQSRPANDDGEVDTVWTIYNPRDFLRMSAVQKRDLLRASGVRSLPRPREGMEALDAVLLDLMDAAVRSEFQRISSSSSGAPGGGDVGGGERSALLRRMGEALENDDLEVATALREEFAFKTALRADPTQEVGSYDPYLDQDDWYAEARRKAMQPKKKP